MKIFRTNRIYAFQGVVTTPLVLMLLFWSAELLQIFPYFAAISLLFVLMLIVWRDARIPMSNTISERLPPSRWLGSLVGLQAGYLCFLMAVLGPLWQIRTSLSGTILPSLPQVAHHWSELLQYGFPWYFAIFFAVAMGYFGLIRHDRPEMMSVLEPLFGKKAYTRFGALFDLNLRFSCSAINVFILTFIVVGILFWIAPLFGIDFFKLLTPIQIFIFVAMLSFFRGPTWSKWLSHMVMQRWRITSVLFIQIAIMAVVSIGLYYIFNIILSEYLKINNPFPVRFHEMIKFINMDQAISWLIISLCLGWAPVLGSAIARVSRGYSIRQMILGASLFPLSLIGLIWFNPNGWIEQFFVEMMTRPQFFVLSLMLYGWTFREHIHLNRLFYGNIGPESLSKYRSPYLFLSSNPNSVLISLLMVFGFGYKFFSFFSFYFGFIAWFMIMLSVISLSLVMLNIRQTAAEQQVT